MKTALMGGKLSTAFDDDLLTALNPVPATLQDVWSEQFRIGILNEHGEIYRVIGTAEMDDLLDVITKLDGLGYNCGVPLGYANEVAFDVIVGLPNF